MSSILCSFFIFLLFDNTNSAGIYDDCRYQLEIGTCDLYDECPDVSNDTYYCDYSFVCCPRPVYGRGGSGGVVASRNEFPHMALIGYATDYEDDLGQWRCGGSLVTKTFVLSAAHCNAESTPTLALLGVNDYVRDYPEGEIRSIIEVIDHPEYDFNARVHDICLYRLNASIEYSKNIKLICLPDLGVEYPSKVFATGWGATSLNSGFSQILLKMELNLWDRNKCHVPYNETNQICAGSDEAIDTCSGDSGGPLQVKENSYSAPCDFIILGIVSHGKACFHRNGTSSIYSNVSSYLRWIKEIVWYGTLDCDL